MNMRVVFALLVVAACDGPDPNHTPADAATDAPVDAFVCPVTPDEPSGGGAVATGVASMQSSAVMPGLLICPADDRDYFTIVLPTGANLEIVIETAGTEPSVIGSLLNSSGTPIFNATPIAGMNARRIYVPNLPSGNYTVQTLVEPAAISHYELSITATDS